MTSKFRFFCAAAVLLLVCALEAAAQTAPAPDLSAQMLNRTATLALKVGNYEAVRGQTLEAANAENAALMDARTQVDAKGRKHGWMRLRVDASRLPRLLAVLRPLGTLYAENVDTTDQVSDYEALGRRVERLQQHEQRLGGVLESPRRMRGSDILYLQERLFRASVDESLLTQQKVDLQRAARESTLVVQLFEPGSLPPDTPQRVDLHQWFLSGVSIVQASLNRLLARGATASAYAAVYAPFWIPAALAALLVLAVAWRQRRRMFALLLQTIVGAAALTVRLAAWLREQWDVRRGGALAAGAHAAQTPPGYE